MAGSLGLDSTLLAVFPFRVILSPPSVRSFDRSHGLPAELYIQQGIFRQSYISFAVFSLATIVVLAGLCSLDQGYLFLRTTALFRAQNGHALNNHSCTTQETWLQNPLPHLPWKLEARRCGVNEAEQRLVVKSIEGHPCSIASLPQRS